MEQETLTATPPEQGATTETVAQETQTTSQEGSTPQGSGTVSVDNGTQPASSPATPRPQASKFYRQRERTRLQLERQAFENAQLKQRLEELEKTFKSGVSKPTEPVEDKFWDTPVESFDKLRETIRKLEKAQESLMTDGIPKIISEHTEKQTKVNRAREALDMIFPKPESVARETDEKRVARIKSDPNFEEMLRIEEEFELSKLDPLNAAKFIVKMLPQKPQPKPNPFVPKKTQMSSTASSNATPNKGVTKMDSIQEVSRELETLTAQMGEKPEIRFEEDFQKRLKAVKDKYVLLRANGNQQ